MNGQGSYLFPLVPYLKYDSRATAINHHHPVTGGVESEENDKGTGYDENDAVSMGMRSGDSGFVCVDSL